MVCANAYCNRMKERRAPTIYRAKMAGLPFGLGPQLIQIRYKSLYPVLYGVDQSIGVEWRSTSILHWEL